MSLPMMLKAMAQDPMADEFLQGVMYPFRQQMNPCLLRGMPVAGRNAYHRMMKHFTTVPRSIAVDITETEQQYVVTGDVPGCEKDDVDVELDDDNILTISVKKESKVEEDLAPESAEDSEAKEDKDVSAAGEDSAEKESIAKTTYPIFHRIERRTEFQSRSLKLPSNIVHDSMAAKLDNGILTISVDKVVPITKKRSITIQ